MATLYLMRHGQTEFNVKRLVQGHCDSPLTELGVAQAHEAGAWIARQGVTFARICTSPLGRAVKTAGIVREELAAGGDAVPAVPVAPVPDVEVVDGLIERDYGSFEQGPKDDVPGNLWDPGESVVPFGGEGSRELRQRMVETLTTLMLEAARGAGDDGSNVLAVSHGSATRQFKLAWEHLATCPQDAPIGNCCVLVYTFDPAERTFVNERIVNLPSA